MREDSASHPGPGPSVASKLMRQPRIVLFLLAAWCVVELLTQLFVNSGYFLDIHDAELDGALGGLALNFDAVALALLYLYCARNPYQHFQVFWIALVHQTGLVVANVYHFSINTYSGESVIIPIGISATLAACSFFQIFSARPQTTPPSSPRSTTP